MSLGLSFQSMQGKRILLGVTGSIAAYKSAVLVRILVKAGAEVKVVMTRAACEFVTPLTFSVLSKNDVFTTSHDSLSGHWNNHVDLGMWADAMVIAPASANTIAKMANGITGSHLLDCYLSARCPVFIAPAMDLDMLQHPAVQMNLKKLASFNKHHIIAPTDGELASGLFGEGRMEEPEKIYKILADFFYADLPLRGKKALVTAGPTYEAIDPVRFIGNRSSGRMGFAIAEELAKRGAEVKLVSGPSHLDLKDRSVQRTNVVTAEEMFSACMKEFPQMDIIVMSAAVADYKPGEIKDQKISKKNNPDSLQLVSTTDILKSMGENKKSNQFLVGFALETHDELEHAKEKLQKKNLDMIVLNSLNDDGAGFEVATNKVTFISRDGTQQETGLKAKTEVARDLIDIVTDSIKQKK
jgi:phosphopantothenoylcysteine decarboxylase/phosphopantothenate--cysteine ligase